MDAPAVECFFVISGFYMALVLDRKYGQLRGGGLWPTFMGARIARLYPVYLAVLAATAVVSVLHVHGYPTPLLSQRHELAGWSLATVLLANVTMLGQDVVTFSAINAHGALHVVHNLALQQNPAHPFLLIPQAWSLSLELMFYALAPWLLFRRTRTLVCIIAGALLLRAAMAVAGLDADPWNYRFFPIELSLFLAGSVAYRVTKTKSFSRRSGVTALAIGITAIISFQWVKELPGMPVAFPLLFAVLVPPVFALTARSMTDHWVGELSYPLYLVHVLIIRLTPPTFGHSLALVDVPLSIAAAAALLLAIDVPLESARQRWIERRLHRPVRRAPVVLEHSPAPE